MHTSRVLPAHVSFVHMPWLQKAAVVLVHSMASGPEEKVKVDAAAAWTQAKRTMIAVQPMAVEVVLSEAESGGGRSRFQIQ